MIALIDGDIVAYRCAASCQQQGVLVEPLEVGIGRCEQLMERILQETGSTSYRCFFTGKNNFRKKIYPAYKAHRDDIPRPAYLGDIRDHLRALWSAEEVDTLEADDLMGIAQTEAMAQGNVTVICSLDKDMLQVPGLHYNWVKQQLSDIPPIWGWHNYYVQLIMGDRADNIPGYDGKMRQKVPKFLQDEVDYLLSLDDPDDMDEQVRTMYADQDQYEINKKLFWILREMPELDAEKEKTTTDNI